MVETLAYKPLPQTNHELYEQFAHRINGNIDEFRDRFEVITGRGNRQLARQVGEMLGKHVDEPCNEFADNELRVEIGPNLRGREVFILQSLQPRPNDRIQETVLMADAAIRGDAKDGEVSAIIPYFAYSRQDRKPKSRTPISVSAVANQFVGAGISRMLSIDLHAEQSTGAIKIPWDIIYANKLLLPAIAASGGTNMVVASPDMGGAKRAEKVAKKLGMSGDVAVVHKQRDVNSHDTSEALKLIGDVKDRDVLFVDDILGTGGTIFNAAAIAKEQGAKRVIVAVTHGFFLPDQENKTILDKMDEDESPIEQIFVTDTIEQRQEVRDSEKVTVVSIAPMLAVAIMCYLTHESISEQLID